MSPTRDKSVRANSRKCPELANLASGGKTYTTKQIAKNTALNKARLSTCGNVAKGAEADLKQAMKKNLRKTWQFCKRPVY